MGCCASSTAALAETIGAETAHAVEKQKRKAGKPPPTVISDVSYQGAMGQVASFREEIRALQAAQGANRGAQINNVLGGRNRGMEMMEQMQEMRRKCAARAPADGARFHGRTRARTLQSSCSSMMRPVPFTLLACSHYAPCTRCGRAAAR